MSEKTRDRMIAELVSAGWSQELSAMLVRKHGAHALSDVMLERAHAIMLAVEERQEPEQDVVAPDLGLFYTIGP